MTSHRQPTPAAEPAEPPILADRRWYVAVVKPQRQYRDIARKALKARGYEVLMPMARELEIRDHRKVEVDRPLYGRYLFVGASPGQDGWSVRWCPGIQHITLDSRHRPVTVAIPVLETIVERMLADGGFVDLRPKEILPRFVPGQPVTLLEGQFAGWQGLFDADEGKRCRVLIGLFGREMTVKLPMTAITEAQA